jgi:hypothetical protein
VALSAFADKSQEPQAAELQETPGRSSARWDELDASVLALIDAAPKYAEGRGVHNTLSCTGMTCTYT